MKTYGDLAAFMKDQAWNSYKGKTYGVPHGWGANVLLWNQDVVTPAPTSWSVVFDKSSPYAGKITAPDNPIYIADAALYLSKTQPDLGITNPYALDQTQFDAAVALLKQQKANIGEYWDYRDQGAGGLHQGQQRGRRSVGVPGEPGASRRQGRPAGGDRHSGGGRDRVVRQLVHPLRRQAPELRLRVDQLDHVTQGAGPGVRVLR